MLFYDKVTIKILGRISYSFNSYRYTLPDSFSYQFTDKQFYVINVKMLFVHLIIFVRQWIKFTKEKVLLKILFVVHKKSACLQRKI